MATMVHVKAHTRKAPKTAASSVRKSIKSGRVERLDIGDGLNVLRPKVSMVDGNARGFSSGEVALIKRFNRMKTR